MFSDKTRVSLALCLTPLLIAAGGPAADSPLVCSLVRAVECDGTLNCGPPINTLGAAPTFLNVDLDGKRITILAPAERRGETTEIRAIERTEDRVVLTGIEAGRGWSMIIFEEDNSMILTMTAEGSGFVVFGNCIDSEMTSP